MSLVNGPYKIFSAAFPSQDADLSLGQPTAFVEGNVKNTDSLNMVWNLQQVGSNPNQFTLSNAAPSSNGAYAHVTGPTAGTKVQGSTDATEWFIYPLSNAYVISSPSATGDEPTENLWTLLSGDNGTPITIQQFVEGDNAQLWNFQPYTGETKRGLSELD